MITHGALTYRLTEPSLTAPIGKGRGREGKGREERNWSSISNWRHPERPQMDGSLRDQSAGV